MSAWLVSDAWRFCHVRHRRSEQPHSPQSQSRALVRDVAALALPPRVNCPGEAKARTAPAEAKRPAPGGSAPAAQPAKASAWGKPKAPAPQRGRLSKVADFGGESGALSATGPSSEFIDPGPLAALRTDVCSVCDAFTQTPLVIPPSFWVQEVLAFRSTRGCCRALFLPRAMSGRRRAPTATDLQLLATKLEDSDRTAQSCVDVSERKAEAPIKESAPCTPPGPPTRSAIPKSRRYPTTPSRRAAASASSKDPTGPPRVRARRSAHGGAAAVRRAGLAAPLGRRPLHFEGVPRIGQRGMRATRLNHAQRR